MSSTCASDEQIEAYRSPIYKTAVLFNCFVVLTSVILLSTAARQLCSQSIIQSSTRIFLLFSLFFCFCHQFGYSIMKIISLYQIFYELDQPCDLYFSSSECSPINRIVVCGNCGIILIESAMSIDRILASFSPQNYPKLKYLPGLVMSITVALVSASLFDMLTIGDPLSDIVPNCGYVPQKSAHKFNSFLSITFYLSIAHIIIDILVLRWNIRQEKIEKKLYHMTERYRTRELLKCTQAIVSISMAQFVLQMFYSGLTNYLFQKQLNHEITPFLYGMAISLAYTTPYTCVVHPLLIILTLRNIKVQRKKSIRTMTSLKDTQEDHMSRMHDIWNQ